jgi:hypothetical protein
MGSKCSCKACCETVSVCLFLCQCAWLMYWYSESDSPAKPGPSLAAPAPMFVSPEESNGCAQDDTNDVDNGAAATPKKSPNRVV